MDAVLESDRDRRTLDWLISQVGLAAVEQASFHLAGERKAYVLNIAKLLKLTPPASVFATPKDDVLVQLAAIKNLLKAGRRRG